MSSTTGTDPPPVPVRADPVQHFPVLDALRAVGAVAVLTTHVAFYSGDYGRHGVLGGVLARLDIGVALFFVLSGFLLARPWLARASVGLAPPATATYYVKRLLRIYPVYAVAVVLALVLARDNADLGLRDWLVTLGLLNTFVDPLPPAALTQMWSLGVEVSFYVVLPLVMLLATGRRRLRPARVLGVLCAGLVVTAWWHLDGAARVAVEGGGPPLQWLPAYLAWFALGIALALVHVLHVRGSTSPAVGWVLRLGAQPGVCWVLAGAALLVAATPLGGPADLGAVSPAQSLTRNLLFAVAAGLVVLTGVAADDRGRFGRVLGGPLPRRLGLVSYSIFCLHLLVLELWARATGWSLFGGHGLQLWVLTLLSSIALAELAYRFVEVPGTDLRRRFQGRSRARSEVSSGARTGAHRTSETTTPTKDTSAR